MKKGYIAGSLFKEADIKQRLYEESVLKEKVPNVKFHNPINDPEANDKSKDPTAKTIFDHDTAKVIASDYIVAELDGEDPGVCMELGIAYGINYMLDLIATHGAETALRMIPRKEVYAHLSDIRIATAGHYDGRYVPKGNNQYVLGGIEEMGQVMSSFNDVAKLLEEKEN